MTAFLREMTIPCRKKTLAEMPKTHSRKRGLVGYLKK